VRKPADRPRVTELQAWLRGEGLERAAAVGSQAVPQSQSTAPHVPVPPQKTAPSSQPSQHPLPAQPPRPAPIVMPEATTPAPPIAPVTPPVAGPASKPTTRLVIRAELTPKDDPETSVSQQPKWRVLPLTVAAVAVLGIIWAGVRIFTKDKVVVPSDEVARQAGSLAPAAVPNPSASAPASAPESVSRSAPVAAPASAPVPAGTRAATSSARAASTGSTASTNPVERAPATSPETVNEVIPDVSLRARQTIRGTVRVSVRLIVDKDGKVFAALTEKAGPSRYFERLALDAAKQWTFTPADAEGQRIVLVRFNFKRSGTTARATPVR
jgi:TonB family protein